MRLPPLRRCLAGLALAACGCARLAAQAPAATSEVHTNVVVDSNPAVFAVLAALNAAGYDAGLPAAGQPTDASLQLRQRIRAEMLAHPTPALAALRDYYKTHGRPDANQNLAQYVTLALFLGNPPGLTLTLPVAGLPPDAAAVADAVPLLQNFYAQANLDNAWQQAQPQYQAALARDAAAVRHAIAAVDAFFRIPHAYSPRQFFVFPDAMIAANQSDALSYQDNYYMVANLDLAGQIQQVRHTYLHFILDPLIANYPAAILPVEQQLLPLVARAPALGLQFKRDPDLLYTECLVRAAEIQLDPGTPEQKQAAADAASAQGLVLTPYWFAQLTAFRSDPSDFTEFYPYSAFAIPFSQLAGQVKHMSFAATAAPVAADVVQPTRAPGLLEQGEARFDARDFAAASVLANAELRQPRGDRAGAYYLLGKVSAEQNQPPAAMANFEQALATALPAETHFKTWSNIYLARLYDAENNRAQAVVHYQAALLTADTPSSQDIAKAGVKAPFRPPAAPH